MFRLRIAVVLAALTTALVATPAHANPPTPPLAGKPPPIPPRPTAPVVPLPNGAPPLVADYPRPLAGTADLRGVALDARTGKRIPGATVSVTPYARSIVADQRGEFALTGLQISGPFAVVTITVSAPGYGIWKRIDDRLYRGHWVFFDAHLGTKDVISTAIPPLAEIPHPGPVGAASNGRFGYMRPLETPGVPAYTDQWLPPPSIRVERLVKNTSDPKQRCAPVYPLQRTPDGTQTYPFEYYINKVLPNEIQPTPTYWMEAIKANAMVIKNYAWYWINRGGKVFANYPGFTDGDVDDTTQYQCFDPNSGLYDDFVSATSATKGLGIHVGTTPNETIYQTSYLGYIEGNEATYEKCGDSDGTVLYQLGSKAWAGQDPPSPGCLPNDYKDMSWILHHYYSGITIFTVPPPRDPSLASKRTNEQPVTIHFESRGAWEYQVFKWTGSSWSFQAGYSVDGSGNVQNWFTDNNVAQGSGYWYAACAKSSAQWSGCPSFWVPEWTTDLWNADFDNALNGDQSWFWSSFNNPTTSVVSGWTGSALRMSSPAGVWASAYQDVPFTGTNFCPNLVAHEPTGSGVVLSLFVYQFPSNDSYSMTWWVPGDANWYRIPLNPDGCRTFTNAGATLRFIVRLDNGGTIDLDHTRLVYDSATYWRY